MDTIISILTPVSQFLIEKFPALGTYGAIAIALCLGLGVVIEAAEAVFEALKMGKAEEEAKKLDAIQKKVVAALEILPHVNVPLAGTIAKIAAVVAKAVKALDAAIQAWKS